ncbi:Glycosyl hydrolases family 2, sugar binding domain [Maioricimonas rarisocia]|uniref:Glycosyl hydrolases family 2, sugar binding domain n=1 Tax=Maioricimonas rarisocia TaxID=2528026 RepID=A0A517ZG63_9PLAN|nr:hypothetical protein [Maioricimonas rarisocia]QDU41432.1 Glycosyl hydrolases family 2, sugar binding domain [Maioricimonas rarisocia]
MQNSREIHRIRLRGPWEVALGKVGESAPADASFRRVTMPASWQELFGNEAGTGWFRRRFNQPTGLEPHERVCIALPDVPGDVHMALNGTDVASQPASASRLVADVTDLLQLANRLEVRVTFDPGESPETPGGLWQTVHLEIHNEKHASR